MNKMIKRSTYVLAGILGITVITSIFLYFWLSHGFEQAFIPKPPYKNAKNITSYTETPKIKKRKTQALVQTADLNQLLTPSLSARPWARWWWPGGDITANKACEELQTMNNQGFGGVEIQAFNFGLEHVDNQTTQARINSFGDTQYHQTLNKVMDCAEQYNIAVYLNHLSGWPAGGPQVLIEDGLHTFAATEISIEGGKLLDINLPKPKPVLNNYLLASFEVLINFAAADFAKEHARFVSAVAMKTTGGNRSGNVLNATDTLELDKSSAIVLDRYIVDGQLNWHAPEGDWTIVSTYIMPAGEAPTLVAQEYPGYVIDHLRTEHVKGHYNYAYGSQTKLDQHYGKAFKGFFNDSLEFKVDRLSTQDILEEFEKRRGYDLRPLLPAIYVDVIDNYFAREVFGLYASPQYLLDENDERIRHDYQQTLSDLMIERFLETSHDWAEKRNLLSRGQSYGMDLDILHALGSNHIPETEQLFGGGTLQFMKMASSAGALYSRPLITAESFVWGMRDYAIAPRQIKAGADTLFTSGVNQIIYHGIPYAVEGKGYKENMGEIPWHPFSGPSNFSHFSENYGPWSTSWDAQKELNSYFQHAQALLQSGRQDIDVFIYYPWLGFPSYFEETKGLSDTFLFKGYMPEDSPLSKEPPTLASIKIPFIKIGDRGKDKRVQWLGELSQLTQELDNKGVTWAWINDHSLQNRPLKPSGIADSEIKSVIIANTTNMPLETTEALQNLTQQGLQLSFIGARPHQQSGYFDKSNRDAAIKKNIDNISQNRYFDKPQDLSHSLDSAITFTQQNGTLKRTSRILHNSDQIHFFTNLSVANASATLSVNKLAKGQKLYWFDAVSTKVWPAIQNNTGELPLNTRALESRFLLVTSKDLPLTGAPVSVLAKSMFKQILKPSAWTLTANDTKLQLSNAFIDLKDHPQLKYASAPLEYTTTFKVTQDQTQFILELGRIEGTARVFVNEKEVAMASFDPAMVELSKAIKIGSNTIKVSLTPPMRNELVGRALAGDKAAKHMKRFEHELTPVGVFGPTVLYSQ